MKIRTKSALFTGFLILFLLLLGETGRRRSKTGLARLEAFQEELHQAPLLLTRIQMRVSEQLLAWKDILLASSSTASREAAWRKFEEIEAKVLALTGTLAKSSSLDAKARQALTTFQSVHELLGKISRNAFAGSRRSRTKSQKAVDQEIAETSKRVQDLLTEVRTGLAETDRDRQEAFRADLTRGEWWIVGVMILGSLLLGGLGIYLHERWITRPILEAQEMARKIASGGWNRGDIQIQGNDNLSELLRCLNDMHEALEKRSQELVQARDHAREGSQAKTEFLSRMSQEMRTPLVGILGTTELLQSTDLEPDQKDFVETLALSSRHLVAMVEDILDFAQVDSGQFEIAEDEFDVRALFEDIVEPMVAQAHGKSLELGCMIERKVPGRLIGDPRRIRHVAHKLISNALRFTQRGGVTISISLLEDSGKTCQLRVDVRDTGGGMDAKANKRIKAAFAQKDDLLMRQGGELGIGLSLAKRIVNRMGGHLDFETVKGKGSHFWFRLRLAKVEAKAVQQNVSSEERIDGRRVLCVVDNEVGKAIFGGLMGMMKLEVDWAVNPLQARFHLVQAAQEGYSYAMILLDSQLPSLDLEFLAELRRDKQLGEQRILFLTKPLIAEDRKRAQELAIDRILVKPCREATLRETIQEEVRASKLGRQGKAQESSKPFDARILLVDDNTVNQRVGKRLLEKLGCSVDLAADGRVGLEMSGLEDYDIIFMDCHMPEMDGYQTTIAIRDREQEGGRRNCIIAMTADGIQGVRESCLASGMDDYAVKPIRKDQLHELLEKWLGEDAPRQTAQTVLEEAAV